MIFSARFATAIHTLLIINEFSKEEKVTSDTIAERMDTSPVLIRNLLGQLKKAGFIAITPGKRKKGITLMRPLNEITVLDVFCSVEPNHEQNISNVHSRFAKRSPAGQYLNEIISEQIITIMDAAKNEMAKVTLSDILAELVKREALSPYEDTRALLDEYINVEMKNPKQPNE